MNYYLTLFRNGVSSTTNGSGCLGRWDRGSDGFAVPPYLPSSPRAACCVPRDACCVSLWYTSPMFKTKPSSPCSALLPDDDYGNSYSNDEGLYRHVTALFNT